MMFQPTEKTTAILIALINELPDLAKQLIHKNKNLSPEAIETFASHPDDSAEHAYQWHQFGIITHSKRIQQFLENSAQDYLEQWGIAAQVEKVMQQEIDGIAKAQLFHLAVLLHDTGKFTARTSRGFKGHEEHSGQIIRTILRPLLESHGLTEKQIDYIARCTELHFELGKVRRYAKRQHNYTMAFTKTADFRAECKHVQYQYPAFAVEIGLFFLVDNLSKIAFWASGDTDEELAAQKPHYEATVEAEALPPQLAGVAIQIPINVAVAETYLKLWANKPQDLLWFKLTPESQQKLREALKPLYANHFGDHITLSDNKSADEVKGFIGKRDTVEVYAHATNGQVEAVRVRTHGLPDSYGVPHITLSSIKGVHPFASVAMLKGNHSEHPISPPLVLEGVVEFIQR